MTTRQCMFPPAVGWAVLCLGFGLNQGCSHPAVLGAGASNTAPASEQSVPFHESSEHTDESERPAVPLDQKPESGAPFRALNRSLTLPVGTLITVRLDKSLSLSRIQAGDSFTASLAGPLMWDGKTVIESGTVASGRIESIQASVQPGSEPGFVRLVLTAITVDGRNLKLQTSSLFAKTNLSSEPSGASPAGTGRHWSGLRMSPGRRLTFRLTAPVNLAEANSVAGRQGAISPGQMNSILRSAKASNE